MRKKRSICKLHIILLFFLCSFSSIYAQGVTLKGTVVDETNTPLAGVNVIQKGTTNGTITDVDGKFSLNVPANATILFTYIGFADQEVVWDGRSELNIVLREDTELLDEVVVVGYGDQKKVNLTGAVTQVTAEDFEDRPITQMTQALQGAIPNLNITMGSGKPGTSGSLNIRGNTSINGGSPLVLIDGIPGTLDRINVNDVETVTVLKDASSSAVYGARAAFGVILVTTKRAEDGKPTIKYSGNFGTTTHSTNTDFITSGYWNAKINDEAMYNALGYRATKYSDEDYEELLARVNDKTENPERPWVVIKQNASGKDMYRYYANFDWYNYFYDKWRPKQSHNLTISGSSKNIRYSLSGAHSKEQGIFNIRPDYYKRHNLRSKIEFDVTDWLTISNNTHFFKSSYDWYGFSDAFRKVTNNVSNDQIYHYHAAYVPKNPDGTLTGYTGVNNYPIGYGMHIALENGTMKGYSKGTESLSTYEMIITPIEGLTLTGNYTYREYRSDYMFRQTRGYYSKFPEELEVSSLGALNKDALTETMSKYYWNIINVFGNYKKRFNDHQFNLMLGFNQEDRTYKRLQGNANELLSETLNDLNLSTGEEKNSGGADEWALRGVFGRINYDYKGKYLIETSGRYDGTSRFPKKDRFGFFPSFSLGWRASEEAYFQPLKTIVDNLKFRYSFGTLGNQEVDFYAYIPSMNTGTINYLADNTKLNVVYNPAPVARSLTWETSTTNNIGMDLDILNGRLSFSGDIYTRATKGMLTTGRILPSVFGASEPKENAADLKTNGFEVMLTWKDNFMLGNKPLSYKISGVLSDYTAKITKFDNPTRFLSSYYEGQKLGEIWGYSYDGFFKTTDEAQE